MVALTSTVDAITPTQPQSHDDQFNCASRERHTGTVASEADHTRCDTALLTVHWNFKESNVFRCQDLEERGILCVQFYLKLGRRVDTNDSIAIAAANGSASRF
jgi:hypothetical protein